MYPARLLLRFSNISIILTCMSARNSSDLLCLSLFVLALGCAQIAQGESALCDLLTQKQLDTILGTGVGAGSPIANTGCSWSATGPPKVTVTVSMQTEKMFNGAKASAAPGTTKAPLSGIGDEAIFTGVPNFSSLWVRKGTKFLLVRVYGLPVSEAQTKLKALASDAVSKL